MKSILPNLLIVITLLQAVCPRSSNAAPEGEPGKIDYKNNIVEDCIAVPPSKYFEANEAVLRGQNELNTGKPEAAIKYFENAIRIDPGFYAGYSGLGLAQKKSGNYEYAVNAYLRSIEIDPLLANKDGCLFDNIGNALSYLERFKYAVKYHKKALKLSPNNPTIHMNLGYTKLRMKDYDGAKSSYEKALSLDPEHLGAVRGMSYAMELTGDLDKAIEYISKAFSISNSEIDLTARGFLYGLDGNFSKSCQDWSDASSMGSVKSQELLIDFC
jgi:tetratricopeptide (TPR) repeat protein